MDRTTSSRYQVKSWGGLINYLIVMFLALLSSCAINDGNYVILPEATTNECVLRADQNAQIEIIGNKFSITTDTWEEE